MATKRKSSGGCPASTATTPATHVRAGATTYGQTLSSMPAYEAVCSSASPTPTPDQAVMNTKSDHTLLVRARVPARCRDSLPLVPEWPCSRTRGVGALPALLIFTRRRHPQAQVPRRARLRARLQRAKWLTPLVHGARCAPRLYLAGLRSRQDAARAAPALPHPALECGSRWGVQRHQHRGVWKKRNV